MGASVVSYLIILIQFTDISQPEILQSSIIHANSGGGNLRSQTQYDN